MEKIQKASKASKAAPRAATEVAPFALPTIVNMCGGSKAATMASKVAKGQRVSFECILPLRGKADTEGRGPAITVAFVMPFACYVVAARGQHKDGVQYPNLTAKAPRGALGADPIPRCVVLARIVASEDSGRVGTTCLVALYPSRDNVSVSAPMHKAKDGTTIVVAGPMPALHVVDSNGRVL